ncbi:CYTH domain protein [Aquisphaera giovannonii]|uniref:CYTH domain protein n=1 Tax=Aquisphaera giovannonii TaxID=406548 RepID=A0A5B9WCB2_9BACT|nr:class IV adenylate cyclase [Aquisphaera giovannonii]QEH37581.1 CYTH domain protein [Aquisphaera giovannonii]
MSFEIEVKYRGVDHAAIAGRLGELGARPGAVQTQEDSYFNHPGRDFAETGEAFRVRRLVEEGVNRMTYKGPKHAGPTKTREEIEIGAGRGAEEMEKLLRLLDRLGFRHVATIRKRRESFHLDHEGRPLEVVLDRAQGLGDFAEVEAFAASREDLAAAQRAVLSLAATLGLGEVEPRSYLRMALEQGGR